MSVTSEVMSRCQGDIPAGTKIDRDMLEFIEADAARLGISKAEFFRRLLELYRESRREEVGCPYCEQTVVFDLRE